MATMQDLLNQLAEAQVAGDVSRIVEVAKAIGAKEKDDKKARLEGQKAEVEALGVKIGEALRKIVDKYGDELERLEVKGFGVKGHFTPDQNGVRGGVVYAFGAPKSSGGGGGGGGAGKVKAQYGMSLHEVFEAYANETERAKYAAADTSDGNARYAIKNAVFKRAVTEGLIA